MANLGSLFGVAFKQGAGQPDTHTDDAQMQAGQWVCGKDWRSVQTQAQ
jgi:hypothetical protein